jgi:polyhydroxyalkanoate synthesis regulator phasin
MRFLAPIKFRLLAAGLGALVVAGIAVGASVYATGASIGFPTAAKPSPSPGAQNQACQNFIHHLAQNIGKSDGATRSALQTSADQTIDDAVAAGRLTAAQAAKLKQRLSGSTCGIGPRLPRRAPGLVIRMEVLKAAAETLNLTPQQLMQDLRQGKSLSQLAAGMTEDQFRTALIGHVKTDLDAQVKAGKLTQAQENQFVQKLQTAPIPFWSSAPSFRRPAPASSPAANAGA